VQQAFYPSFTTVDSLFYQINYCFTITASYLQGFLLLTLLCIVFIPLLKIVSSLFKVRPQLFKLITNIIQALKTPW